MVYNYILKVGNSIEGYFEDEWDAEEYVQYYGLKDYDIEECTRRYYE